MAGLLLLTVALALAGCDASPAGTEASLTSSASSSTRATSPVTAPPPAAPTSPKPLPPPPPSPAAPAVTYECGDPNLYQSGTAVYSDGTTGYLAECDTYVPPTGSQDQNGDGVISGFERCGLACGEDATSGEKQAQYGCEQGYITGPLCDAVGKP